MNDVKLNKNMHLNTTSNNYSIPNIDFKKLNNIEANKKEYIIDMRKKQFSLDNISILLF